MKKNLLLIVAILVSIVLAACGSSSASEESGKDNDSSDEKIKLKFATYFPGTSPIYTDFTEPWMEKVTELTGGKVEFDYYPSEQLGKAQDLLSLTKNGVTDISIFPANYYADHMPYSHMLAGLPNLGETSGQGTKAYNELVKENETLLEEDYLKNGVRPIITHVSTPYELWTTGLEIKVPADLKGKKIKTAGGIANEFFEYIGAVPVTISHSETYEALEKKVIDVASYYAMAIKSSGTDELLKYGIEPHTGTVIQSITINENVWQKLPDDVKDAMIKAGESIIEPIGEVYARETAKFNEEFIAKGGVIAELTEEERAQWEKAMDEFTAKWLDSHSSDNHSYEEILNAYKEKLEKYKE